jgi:hypothetical protein
MSAVLGELCRGKGIPSIMIPHGSFTPVQDEHSKKEWAENARGIVNTPYGYLALQTPLIEKFLEDIPVKSRPVMTGPLIFGRENRAGEDVEGLRKKYALPDEKIILHAGTPKHRKSQRLLNYETLDEYVDGIASLIRAVDRIDGARLIIRYRVIDGLGIEDLKSILPKSEKFSIASGGSFSDYLSIADLLVSYSSSTMEEALQNDIPVLLYNKYDRYQHLKGLELSKISGNLRPAAVYNVNSEGDLLFALEWILKNHLSGKGSMCDLFEEYKYAPERVTRISELIENARTRGEQNDIIGEKT